MFSLDQVVLIKILYIAVPLVQQQAKAIEIHTNLSVGQYVGEMGVDLWEGEKWHNEFVKHHVLVMTAQIFLDIVHHGFLALSKVNLLIFDECHHAVKSHPYAQIMKCFDTCPSDSYPHVLGLTASILNSKCSTPQELEDKMKSLEVTLRCTTETATDMVTSDMYGAKPKELVIECEEYDDSTGLVAEMDQVLQSALSFVQDCAITFDQEGGQSDPRSLPKTVLTETLTILHQLGPWCAGKVASALRRQLDKITDREVFEINRQFSQMASTKLSMVATMVEFAYEHKVMSLDDFKTYMSPRVLRLFEILQQYKPEDNFMIIGNDASAQSLDDLHNEDGAENEGDDDDEDEDEDDDSLNLSDDDFQEGEEGNNESGDFGQRGRGRKSQVHYVAVKRTEIGESKSKEENSLCGLVFVERRHTAFALNKLIQEMCNWEPDLYFIQSNHITGQGTKQSGGKETETMYKKQEDLLRRFRNRDVNLLVSTSVLEEGVDVPRCNLVVRFDMPNNFRSYIQSKVMKHDHVYLSRRLGNEYDIYNRRSILFCLITRNFVL